MTKIKITDFEGVYSPAEDSYLFVNHIPAIKGNVLEIGCGTGIIGINLAARNCNVTAVDINPLAVEATKFNSKINNLRLEVIESNMFSQVVNRKFDVIVCNPPYLPPSEEEYDDYNLSLAVEGGPTGSEFTLKLLEEASNYLNESGSLYLIISSKMDNLNTEWKQEIIHQEKYFFERLQLVRFWI